MAVRWVLGGVLGVALAASVLPPVGHEERSTRYRYTRYRWELPAGFPEPRVPANNPMSAAKVRLGRHLFYDKRLSVNGTQACANCHRQELAFTDGRATALGATGEAHPRGALSLVNAAYSSTLTWNNPRLRSLEEQALIPLFAANPVEMGMAGREQALIRRVRGDPVYRALFPQAFAREANPFTVVNVAKALAAFERTIISARSPYDRFHGGNEREAIPEAAKRGEVLFFTDPAAGCFRCHGGRNFNEAADIGDGVQFHNTGLYNLAGRFSYPLRDLGAYAYTGKPRDVGKFKTPSLRNIALTAPYMHDGSVATLAEAIEHYEAGGRTIVGGPDAGRGHDNPNKDRRLGGFALTEQNREDLIAFLGSLTDRELINDPRFTNPW